MWIRALEYLRMSITLRMLGKDAGCNDGVKDTDQVCPSSMTTEMLGRASASNDVGSIPLWQYHGNFD